MQLDPQHLEIFPYVTTSFSVDQIRLWMVSMFGDGVVEGLEPKLVESRVVISAGTAIVDGVIIHITEPVVMPYSQWTDSDVVLAYSYSSKRPTLPEITTLPVSDKAYIILYSVVSGDIVYDKRAYSLASKNPKALGFASTAANFNKLVNGSSADQLHTHTGIYRISAEYGTAGDNTVITLPVNTVSISLSIKSLYIPDGGATIHCYLTSDNRVRVYADKDGAVVSRGEASYVILKAEYGKSDDPYSNRLLGGGL